MRVSKIPNRTAAITKKAPFIGVLWRRERDLNPRYPYEVHTISSHPPKGRQGNRKKSKRKSLQRNRSGFHDVAKRFPQKKSVVLSADRAKWKSILTNLHEKKARAAKHNKDFGDFAIINLGGRCAAVAEAAQDCLGNRKSGGTRFSLGNPTEGNFFCRLYLIRVGSPAPKRAQQKD